MILQLVAAKMWSYLSVKNWQTWEMRLFKKYVILKHDENND